MVAISYERNVSVTVSFGFSKNVYLLTIHFMHQKTERMMS